jgi:LEA14-like dessication related protein
MGRVWIVVVALTIALFTGIFSYVVIMAHLEATAALSALKLEFAAPVKLDIEWAKGKINIVLVGLIKNTGSRDIEVEGGEYKIFIRQGTNKYALVEGSFPRLYIGANSHQMVPLSAELNVFGLPKTLQSLLQTRSSFTLYVEIILKIPIKFAGIKLGTYPITITREIS